MFARVCLGLLLIAAIPAWSQVEPSATEAPAIPEDDSVMQVPPPVSGEAYPIIVASEAQSNYLRGGVVFDTAYDDNVTTVNTRPVSDAIYTIWPTIELERSTWRQQESMTYSPGFTIYEPTSVLNNVDQLADLNFKYRLTQHATVSARDFLQKTSNVFNQPDPLSGGAVSGSPQPQVNAILAPFAERLLDVANADLSYQFGRNDMAGGGGSFTELDYPNPAQATGLSNGNSRAGSAFLSHRLFHNQYTGLTYQYIGGQANSIKDPSKTQTQTLYPFYTVYFERAFSLSLSGGPQHFEATQTGEQPRSGWTPAAMASIGWQRTHTNFEASYSRSVSNVEGLAGAFDSNSAGASARWQMGRTWVVGANASYSINKSVTPLFVDSIPGGHGISGTVLVQHSISEHFSAKLGYSRLHQSYNGIPAAVLAPDTSREFFLISYQFRRPLGR
jgi:hypothetical protein